MCDDGLAMFYRDGTPAGSVPAKLAPRGSAAATRVVNCYRCGGAGGADKWKPTGWTCYRCGGKGTENRTVRIFTADKLAALDAAKAKRDAKKAAENEAKRLAFEAAAAARRETFLAQHGELIAAARPYIERSDFVAEIVAKADRTAELTERQLAALANAIQRIAAEDKRRAAATHVGTVGERLAFAGLKVCSVAVYPSQYGQFCIVAMRDADGNAVVYKGSRTYGLERGDSVDMVATIKAHDVYRGEPQTVLARPKLGAIVKAEGGADC